MKNVFVVVSTREYENESYVSADGVFTSYKKAEEYVLRDMRDTLDEEEISAGDGSIDEENFRIESQSTGHSFRWQIDPVFFGD